MRRVGQKADWVSRGVPQSQINDEIDEGFARLELIVGDFMARIEKLENTMTGVGKMFKIAGDRFDVLEDKVFPKAKSNNQKSGAAVGVAPDDIPGPTLQDESLGLSEQEQKVIDKLVTDMLKEIFGSH